MAGTASVLIRMNNPSPAATSPMNTYMTLVSHAGLSGVATAFSDACATDASNVATGFRAVTAGNTLAIACSPAAFESMPMPVLDALTDEATLAVLDGVNDARAALYRVWPAAYCDVGSIVASDAIYVVHALNDPARFCHAATAALILLAGIMSQFFISTIVATGCPIRVRTVAACVAPSP